MRDSTADLHSGTAVPVRVAGIILAAGQSSRMGRCKALLPLEGRPVLSHVIGQALACGTSALDSLGLDPLVLVLGGWADDIRSGIDLSSVTPVENTDYASGMASSIRAGLDRVARIEAETPSPCTGALFILGDQPQVPATVFTRLIQASATHPGRILIPTFEGTMGNPVLFNRRFFPELRDLSGDVGGRVLFDRHPDALIHVPVDEPGICRDLDTWADYQALAGEGTGDL